MQAHLSGKSHKKKTKQINRFACDLCLIEVSSQETLQTHYQGNNSRSDVLSKRGVYRFIYQTNYHHLYLGMAHIKRAKVAEEAKREAENPMNGNIKRVACVKYFKHFLRK